MIEKEQLVDFLEGIAMKDDLEDKVTIGQVEEINRKLVARIDTQQAQLDGLQSMIGTMQVKITQLQLQVAKMGEMLAEKEMELAKVAAMGAKPVVDVEMPVKDEKKPVVEEKPVKNEGVKPVAEVKPVVEENKPAVEAKEVEPAKPAEEAIPTEIVFEDEKPVAEDTVVAEPVKKAPVKQKPEPVQDKPVKQQATVAESKEKSGTQTIAESIKGEESLAEKLSKRLDQETVASNINSSKIERIQTAITIADRFRFQRELFGTDAVRMANEIDKINSMKNLEDALAYIEKTFDWNLDSQAVQDFLRLVQRRFA